MGRMCVVFGCGMFAGHKSGVSMHCFPPAGSPYRRLWIYFVKTTRQHFSEPTGYQGVCGLHFADDCFEDQYTHLLKQQAGFRRYRKLKVDAVPSILTEKCIAALSKHSPAAAASTRQANTESVRENRIRKRELLKDIDVIKRARANIACSTLDKHDATPSCSPSASVVNITANVPSNILSESCKLEMPSAFNYDPKFTDTAVETNIAPSVHHHGTLNKHDATPSCSSSASEITANVPFNILSESCELEMPYAFNYHPKFTDAGVGTNITPVVHHRGTLANMKLLWRSKGIWIKPKLRTIAIQCNLHTCDCTKATTVSLIHPISH